MNSSRVKRDAPVKLLVNTILPNKDNIRLISTYQIMTYVKTVCITDLTKNTFYNICLCTDFVDGIQNSNEKICMQNMTSNTADPEANSCFKATSTSTEKVEGTGSAGKCWRRWRGKGVEGRVGWLSSGVSSIGHWTSLATFFIVFYCLFFCLLVCLHIVLLSFVVIFLLCFSSMPSTYP